MSRALIQRRIASDRESEKAKARLAEFEYRASVLVGAADRLEGCRSLSPDIAVALNQLRQFLAFVNVPMRSRSWEQHKRDVSRLREAGMHDAARLLEVQA
jgi:hypothetical protein